MDSKNIKLYNGDCLHMMAQLDDNSVDSIVTDPPYGLSFMGKKWDYDVPSVEIWSECLRVLKPGGHLLAFAGTRTQHRMAVNIENAGFEIRDMIAWVYGSGFPKSLDVSKAIDKAAGAEREKTTPRGKIGTNKTRVEQGYRQNEVAQSYNDAGAVTDDAKQWDGWGTALKPALEPITMARKPLYEKTVAANVLEHGTGAINVDGCRVSANGERLVAGGSLVTSGGDDRTGAALGMFQAGTPNTFEQNPLGRWPANLIHDGSDEVLELFPDSKGQHGDVRGTEPSRVGGDGTNCYSEYGRVQTIKRGDCGSAARFFYCAKASRKDRNEGLDDPGNQFKHGSTLRKIENTNTKGNNHPTVKPTDLMRYLCRLVTPPNGIVLDPFMGSGSTGKAALAENFGFIGIELDADYFNIAQQRIAAACVEVPSLSKLFASDDE